MISVNKKQKFDSLVRNVVQCDLCERMRGRQKVLSERNGDINASVVFIGEAPGRLGADRTLVPFYGDQSGRNFERLLAAAGLTRTEVFVTNAILCNPRNGNGTNAVPARQEIRNCSMYLSLVLDIIQPELVVTLGRQALTALNVIEPHSIELRTHVQKPVRCAKYVVLPMYHPGPRAMVHRSLGNQIKDFYVLGEILGRKEHAPRRRHKQQLRLFDAYDPALLDKIVFRMIEHVGSASKFKLTKLLYLLDWHEVKTIGRVLTGSYYIFQKDGPLAIGLSHVLDEMEGHEVSFRFAGTVPTYYAGKDVRCDMQLSGGIAQKVDQILAKYGSLTDSQLKTAAYLTAPVKTMRRRERAGEHILNQPLFEGWVQPRSRSPEARHR